MPGMTGLAMLKKLKAHSSFYRIPVIMLSSSDDEDQIVAALEFGADDYVTKPYIAKVLLARMKTSLRLLQKTLELESLAKTDFLTGLNNRGSLVDLATKAVSQAKRTNLPLVIVMLDIDFFKLVNDDFGHDAGDKVLIEFARILLDCYRDYDISGRVGGEEFVVCMPNTSIDNAVIACERFRKAIEEHKFVISEEGKVISVSVSLGLSTGRGEDIEFESLLHQADMGLYQAKENGRNQVMIWDGLIDSDFTEPVEMITEKTNEEHIELDTVPMSEVGLQENALSLATDEKYAGIDYNIGVNNVLGDDALFAEILVMFYEDHSQDKDKIQQAIIDNDASSLKHLVHTLKGVACSIGAMSLFNCAKELDTAIGEQKVEQYQLLFEGVANEIDKVTHGLENTLTDKINVND